MLIELKDLLLEVLGELEVSDNENTSLKTCKSIENYEEAIAYLYEKLIRTARWKNDYRISRQKCGQAAWEVIVSLTNKMLESKEVRELLNER